MSSRESIAGEQAGEQECTRTGWWLAGDGSNSLRGAVRVEQIELARDRGSEQELANPERVALRDPGLRDEFAGHQLFHDGERIQLLFPALQMKYSRPRVQRPAVIEQR